MKRPLILAAAIAATGCATAPTFDVDTLKPTAEGDQISLTGRFELNGLQFRLYPGNDSTCLSGALTSLAGVPTPDYNNHQMTLTGTLVLANTPAAGAIQEACGRGVVMLANEVTTP
ncbi:MAG TPA: hypothetical protein PLN33_20590 [Hyphomonadaceae bacterium]|nr:hypothetical protein [Hyphomonadaceae bacterium]